MLLLGISFWELIPLVPVLNPVTVPVMLLVWALLGLVYYRKLPPVYALFDFSTYRKYYYWFYAGIGLSVFPAYFFWNQDFVTSLIVNRGLIIYAFIPVLFAIKPSDKEIMRAVIYFTVVYMVVWVVQAVLVPIPITVPFMEKMLGGAPFEIDPGDFGKLLPGYTLILLLVYLKFQQYRERSELRTLVPALVVFLLLFLLQNRGTLFFASGVMLYIVVSMKSAYKPYQLLGFALVGLVVIYLTAGSWLGLIEETRAQAGDMDYDRWKALDFFLTEYPPNPLTYLLGNGRLSFHTDAGANTRALSMAGYDQSDIGIIGFWSIYGLIPVAVIYTMVGTILMRAVYPFYLKALALHLLLIPIAWNFVSSDANVLVLVFYLFAYYAAAHRAQQQLEVAPSASDPASSTAPSASGTSSSVVSSPSGASSTTAPSPSDSSPLSSLQESPSTQSASRPRLIYLSPDCFFDTDYLVLEHLSRHYDITWVALVTTPGTRVSDTRVPRRFAQEHSIRLMLRELNWRKSGLRQLRFDLHLLRELSKLEYDLFYAEDIGDFYFYALQPFYLKRSTTIYGLHDVVPHSSGSGWRALAGKLHFAITRRLLISSISHFQIFSRTEFEKFRQLYPRKDAFYTRLMLKSFGESGARPGSIAQECRLLFFGVIEYYKGLDQLIDALEQLAAEGITHLKLTIAGKGRHWDECATHIKTPGLYQLQVRYIDEAEIPELFSRQHFIVLPYRDASQSGPQMIALNYSLPVITSDADGLSDFVSDGETGYLFARNEEGALTDRLRAVATLTDRDYEALCTRLQHWKATHYSVDENMGRYVEHFNRIIYKPGSNS